MALPLTPLGRAARILELLRKDRGSAAAELSALPVDEQVALVCETPVARREELLDLLPDPAPVIARLPEVDLCVTVKQVGLADAAWILEHAGESQLVACVDLDAWGPFAPDREKLGEWLEAIVEAGPETILRAAHALDPESLVLYLKDRVHVLVRPGGDEAPDWEPPGGGVTLDGQIHLVARRPGDDLEPVLRLLDVLFQQDYWLYFRLLQGVIWELESDAEEWALRWRTGRLLDLGFPPWEEAMPIYGYVRPEERASLPEAESAPLDVAAWSLPVWMPRVPDAGDARHLLFRAAAGLGEDERRGFLYAFVALANKVAVADRLPLGDAESIPTALERAAELASAGLDHVAKENLLDVSEVLRRVPLVRLFRVGASLRRAAPEADRATDGADSPDDAESPEAETA